MKKKSLILIALILCCVSALFAACQDSENVLSIKVLNPKTEFVVGDTIDYQNLEIEVTYSDGFVLKATVEELEATVTEADLTKVGDSYYIIKYKNCTDRVDITVASNGEHNEKYAINSFDEPEFYTEYKTQSAARGADENEEDSDFRLTGETYEVGNANKFIFRPSAKYLDLSSGSVEIKNIDDVKTTARVFVKDDKAGSYSELTGESLADFVTIEKNTYLFKDGSVGKYVKLEISIDEESYDVENLDPEDRVLTAEFVIIDGGYNVYNQTGLSVMADLEKRAWSEIWKCDVTVEGNKVKLTAREDSLKLEADDRPLCEYVDNISTVILHNSIKLDPDNMPSMYFWTEKSDLYTEAYASLAEFSAEQPKLVGSLRDGANNGKTGGSDGDRNYMRVIDVNQGTVDETVYNGNVGIELDIGLNMAKGIYSTKKVSVSGNYQSIVAPAKGERSVGGRILEEWVDTSDTNKVEEPVSHWSLFQMYQSRVEGSDNAKFTIKNLAMQGNNPKDNTGGFHSSGLMLNNSYTTSITFSNVNASQFFTNIVGDNYGDFKFNEEDKFDPNGTSQESFLNIQNSKLYNAYSNMVYMWRSHGEVINSVMKGSGGPLFIMCDGENKIGDNIEGKSDEGGCRLDVDSKSVLEAYATGNENWYASYNATELINGLKSMLEGGLNQFRHSMLHKNEDDVEAINVIAVMICDPDKILNGGNANGVSDLIDIRGKFTQYGETKDEILNEFCMHNDYLVNYRKNAIDKKEAGTLSSLSSGFFPIIEAGYGASRAINGLNPTGSGIEALLDESGQYNGSSAFTSLSKWVGTTSNKLGIYLSAGILMPQEYAPYFGIVVDLYPKA